MNQVIKPVDHVNSSPRIENDYIFIIFNCFPQRLYDQILFSVHFEKKTAKISNILICHLSIR